MIFPEWQFPSRLCQSKIHLLLKEFTLYRMVSFKIRQVEIVIAIAQIYGQKEVGREDATYGQQLNVN